MRSQTSPTPSAFKKRVKRTLVSGKYICLREPVRLAELERPALVRVEDGREHAGESKFGKQSQSMEPSVATSATECRSPMTP